jgi:hypothetical protein
MQLLSSRETAKRLGISIKTLFRHRKDFGEPPGNRTRFLDRGVHFFTKSPGSPQLVWDWEATEHAWLQACRFDQ